MKKVMLMIALLVSPALALSATTSQGSYSGWSSTVGNYSSKSVAVKSKGSVQATSVSEFNRDGYMSTKELAIDSSVERTKVREQGQSASNTSFSGTDVSLNGIDMGSSSATTNTVSNGTISVDTKGRSKGTTLTKSVMLTRGGGSVELSRENRSERYESAFRGTTSSGSTGTVHSTYFD